MARARPRAVDRLDPSDLGRRRGRARRGALRRQGSRLGLARHPARGLPASWIWCRAGGGRPRARARPGGRAPARSARRALHRGRAAPALLGHRDPPGRRALPERARRADRRGARRAARVRRREPAGDHAAGRHPRDVALQGALERPVALSHRSRGRGRPAVRAPGARRRHQQDRQLGRDQQRDPRAAARPARAAQPGLLPHARGRGARRRPALVRAPGLRCSRRTVHEPVLAHVRRGGPARSRRSRGSPRRRTRRSICWRRSPKSCASRWSFERATSSS